MATIEHEMKSVVGQLDQKIAALEGYKKDVEAQVRAGQGLEQNTTALNQINASLTAAKGARRILMDECCNIYICAFEWMPPKAGA